MASKTDRNAENEKPNDPEQGRPKGRRTFGEYRGKIWIADDFDDPLPDEFWLGDENDPLNQYMRELEEREKAKKREPK